jgi:hypothetical protein
MSDDQIYASIYEPLAYLYLSNNNQAKLDTSKTTNNHIQNILIEEDKSKVAQNANNNNNNNNSNNNSINIWFWLGPLLVFVFCCIVYLGTKL